MGILSLTYRRPAQVDAPPSRDSIESSNSVTKAPSQTSERSAIAGIPAALSFDRIVEGGTCPPCTLRDFMNYLIYIEHGAENLQFFLWYRDYVKRFEAMQVSDKMLAKEWTVGMEEDAITRVQQEKTMARLQQGNKVVKAQDIFKGTDFEKRPVVDSGVVDPFLTPPYHSDDEQGPSTAGSTTGGVSYRGHASDAFAAAGIKAPFTIQPFREEMDRVITTYVMDGAPRQLNLSWREQKSLMAALAYTTHPSAFRTSARSIECMLRGQSHPNFIRWSICNGNPARVTFARGLGVSLILLSILAALVLTLSRAGRGYRAIPAVGLVLGVSTLIAAYKGMCVVLHGLHHVHVRPWELFATDHHDVLGASSTSFDSFGSGNSYEEEPWIVRYEKRNIIRKIFDREVWVQEPALRQIQDTIFLQSMLCALLASAVVTAIFVAVPGGRFF